MQTRFTTTLLLAILSTGIALALTEPSPQHVNVAIGAKRVVLRQTTINGPEGGFKLSYEIVDRKGFVSKSFSISDTENVGQKELIPEESCRNQLADLQKDLLKHKFHKTTIDPQQCGGDRFKVVQSK